MSKKIFIFLLGSLLFLVGCGASGITTKSELVEQSTALKADVSNQEELLSRLKKEFDSAVTLLDGLEKSASLAEFNVNLEARNRTVKELTKLNDKQKVAGESFSKTVKQNNTHFPISRIRKISRSLDIALLDRETFMSYLKKVQENEKTLINTFKDENQTKEDLRNSIDSTNQYYGALIQQIEIWQVNTTRVEKDAKKLVKSLN